MKSKSATQSDQGSRRDASTPRRDTLNLQGRYGQIGISAVAAALRYQSEVKNPAYAPVVWQLDRWTAEVAA